MKNKERINKEVLLKENIDAYQQVEEEKISFSKDVDKDALNHEYIGNNEIAGSLNKEEAIDNIKTKCKFKQELVDDDIILSVKHLKQYFFFGKGPSRSKLKAVHDISFDVKKKECFGIVGESGCGKTTTGRSIIKLYNITSGSIYYKGYRIAAGSRWNEKEIKFTKIRLNKKLKELKTNYLNSLQALNNEFNGQDLKNNQDYLTKKELLTNSYNEEVLKAKKFANDIISVQKAKISQIKKDNNNAPRELMNEIQMIFQDPIDSIDPRMTVEDIIKEGLTIGRNIRIKEFNAIKNHLLHDLEASKIKETDLDTYQKRKAAILETHKANLATISKEKDHERVVKALERVGLIADYAGRYPHEFSGGQRQRIGIARALIMNPQLLICDEPISALDVSIRAQIINLLKELQEEMGLSIIFIAHDLSVVKYFCDRIAVMYFGEIVELATSDELFKHPLHPYTKALLSAIPKPNPLTEKARKRIVYDPKKEHDYSVSKPKLVEIVKDHFILANDEEIKKYKEEIKKLDELGD